MPLGEVHETVPFSGINPLTDLVHQVRATVRINRLAVGQQHHELSRAEVFLVGALLKDDLYQKVIASSSLYHALDRDQPGSL